jgi:Uncharacterized conserved protein
MKTKVLSITLLLFAALAAVSCNKPDPTDPVDYEVLLGSYILNNGSYGNNDASLAAYDPYSKTYQWNVFQQANGKKLGDIAQDVLVFGTKMYISVCNSGVIFVVDKVSCKLVGEIRVSSEGSSTPLSPRHFTTFENAAYVSYYEGYVGKIDTASLKITELSQVGPNPEYIAICNQKLYVANSGGMNYPDYGNTVSVLNPVDLHVMKTITVASNPQILAADNENELYLISWGNYADVPACLQKISGETDAVKVIDDVEAPFLMSMGAENFLYLITSSYDANWNPTYGIHVFNANNQYEKIVREFITDGTIIRNPYSITADPLTGLVYIGESDYVTTGTMHVFTYEGLNITSFDTGGMNPIAVGIVTNKN